MFKNVLVGVDGSASGRDAIALATRLTDSDGSLTLAHVYDGTPRPAILTTPGLIEAEHEFSRKLLEQERTEAGLKADVISISSPSPGRGLHQQAEEHKNDLLVVGSCQRGAFHRAMLGDDTRAALNGAPCAVAVAARGYAEHPTPIAKVGVAYNCSPESKDALTVAWAVAKSNGGTVHAMEVVSIPTYAYSGVVPLAVGESVEVMLEHAGERMSELPGVDARAVYGLPGEELAAFGAEMDILIVGSRGYGPVRRLILGSTTDYLERHARCSLLALTRVCASIPETHGLEQIA